jgi:hypothetical protein
MRFKTAVIQQASYFLLFTKYYQDCLTEQEIGRELNTRKRGNGHSCRIYAGSPELGNVKRK